MTAEAREAMMGYLSQVAEFMDRHDQRSVERMVLDFGREYEWQPRPDHIDPGRAKECFTNAFWLARDNDWLYVEGYVLTPDMPIAIHHAWVVDGGGRLIDPTLREPADTECAFCLGEGSVEVPTVDDDDLTEAEPCGMCDGTGEHHGKRRSLDGSLYRGIPFTAEVAAKAILSAGVYGVLTSPLILDGDLAELAS